MKVICNKTNVLMNGRYKAVYEKIAGSDDVIELEQFQVKSITKGSKWQNAVESDYRHIKTKTILCTFVDHSLSVKKTFKQGKRYQVESGRVLGAVAGYVYDEQGDRFTLYRCEDGFECATAKFQAKYF
ncbi:hypothetical protein [Escherichia phage BEK12B]|nr:hypothetical protein [Escherichia phage BEK7]QGH77170.1 hypothetical protein [Escherichia phage BEK1-23]QGH77450.1 hypothetical protein [Escherichia phage BEK12B]QGH77593.1 hypothetical protein [Escherichia phage BEC3]